MKLLLKFVVHAYYCGWARDSRARKSKHNCITTTIIILPDRILILQLELMKIVELCRNSPPLLIGVWTSGAYVQAKYEKWMNAAYAIKSDAIPIDCTAPYLVGLVFRDVSFFAPQASDEYFKSDPYLFTTFLYLFTTGCRARTRPFFAVAPEKNEAEKFSLHSFHSRMAEFFLAFPNSFESDCNRYNSCTPLNHSTDFSKRR